MDSEKINAIRRISFGKFNPKDYSYEEVEVRKNSLISNFNFYKKIILEFANLSIQEMEKDGRYLDAKENLALIKQESLIIKTHLNEN